MSLEIAHPTGIHWGPLKQHSNLKGLGLNAGCKSASRADLEGQLGAALILASGRGSNAMVTGIMLRSADSRLNVSDTLEL